MNVFTKQKLCNINTVVSVSMYVCIYLYKLIKHIVISAIKVNNFFEGYI
jgi:hypothetical protein